MSCEHEVRLTQKAGTKWLEVSDLNTRYFHTMLKHIIKDIYIDNEWCEEPKSRIREKIKT